MPKSVVISVRVDERIRRILEEAGIDIPREVKRFLEDLAVKVETRRSIDRIDRILRRIAEE